MSGLFGGGRVTPAEKPKVKPMPDDEDPRVILARRRKIAEETKSSGRMSTILSGGGRETLGAG